MSSKKRPRPRTSSKSSPRRIAAAQRAAKAIELRSRGATFAVIARRLGYAGRQGAADAVMRALDATLREPADELRTLDLMRLDKLWCATYPRAIAGSHTATLACLRIMDRRARLLGLDVPQQVAARQVRIVAGGVVVSDAGPA